MQEKVSQDLFIDLLDPQPAPATLGLILFL